MLITGKFSLELSAFQSSFDAGTGWIQGKVRPTALNLDLTLTKSN